MILLVGTKLQMIITRMGLRIQERGDVIKGAPVVEPGDHLFWFNRPRLILSLIHLVLFLVIKCHYLFSCSDLVIYQNEESFNLSEINCVWFFAAECISTGIFCLEHSKCPILRSIFLKCVPHLILLLIGTILKKICSKFA